MTDSTTALWDCQWVTKNHAKNSNCYFAWEYRDIITELANTLDCISFTIFSSLHTFHKQKALNVNSRKCYHQYKLKTAFIYQCTAKVDQPLTSVVSFLSVLWDTETQIRVALMSYLLCGKCRHIGRNMVLFVSLTNRQRKPTDTSCLLFSAMQSTVTCATPDIKTVKENSYRLADKTEDV